MIAVPNWRPKSWKSASARAETWKFTKFSLTPVPANRLAPPLVAECFANLECKVANTRLVNKYNLFVLEVLKAWIDPAQKNPKTIHHHGYNPKHRLSWHPPTHGCQARIVAVGRGDRRLCRSWRPCARSGSASCGAVVDT